MQSVLCPAARRKTAGQQASHRPPGRWAKNVLDSTAAVNLNVHVHALVLDGVFAPDGAGVRFSPTNS